MNKTWHCFLFQAGSSRTVCLHSTSFQPLVITTHVTAQWQPFCYPYFDHFPELSALCGPQGWGFILLPVFSAFSLYFSPLPYPSPKKTGSFLSNLQSLDHLKARCVLLRLPQMLEGQIREHGEAPHISASSWEAADEQNHFTQGPRAARLPHSLDNQKPLLQRRLFHPISRSPSFHFPNSFLAAKSTRTDITLR